MRRKSKYNIRSFLEDDGYREYDLRGTHNKNRAILWTEEFVDWDWDEDGEYDYILFKNFVLGV